MDIYPQNLPPAAAAEIRQLREMFPADTKESVRSQAARGIIGGGIIGCMVILFGSISAHTAWLEGTASVSLFVLALVALIRPLKPATPTLEQPLLLEEVRHAQQVARDAMSRAYLDLVVAAIETPGGDDAEASAAVREAIGALGGSVDALAPRAAHETSDDPE